MFADYHLHLENGPLKLQYLKVYPFWQVQFHFRIWYFRTWLSV